MAEARQVDAWNHTALLAVILANANRDDKKKKQPFEIHDFHPFCERPKKQRKSGAELLDKICRFDGIEPSVVTESTPWAKART